ncbi:MAG: RHS repeat-associated core domain-containing protein [Pirellula sp.]
MSVRASDGFGGVGAKSFQVQIDGDTKPPTVGLSTNPESIEATRDVRVFVTATDDVAVLPGSRALKLTGYSRDGSVWLPSDIAIELDSLGRGTINSNMLTVPGRTEHVGLYRFVASARDAAGNIGLAGADGAIILSIVADASPPTIEIKSPTYNQSILEPIDVLGTVDDPNNELAEYWVTMHPNGRPEQSIEVKRVVGNREISQGILASIDTTLLENGQWVLSLYARDMAGNIGKTTVPIQLEGNYKPGVLSLTFTDLDLATPDVPIKVQRSYRSSRSDKVLDFGRGWALDFGIPKIEIAYQQNASPGSSGYPVLLDGTRVTVTLSDGTVEGFTFQPYPKDPNLLGISISWIPFFIPDKGNTSFLEADDTPVYRIANGESWEYISFSAAESYHPASRAFGGYWKLHLQGGTQLHVDARTENTAWLEDRNGNRTTLSPNGVEHWSGRRIAIARDAAQQNRISSITDSLGFKIEYGYNSLGNLISVKDRSGQISTMTYHDANANVPNQEYLLKSILDAAGREQLVAAYSSDRRLATLKDVENWSTGFSYDLRNRVQSIDEGNNGSTGNSQIVMDRRGNPVKVSDATNVLQINRYDNDGNLTQQRQVVGTTDSGIGVNDDLLTSYEYNQFGQPISVTDTQGGTSQYIYDDRSHLVSTVISSAGLSTNYNYDPKGNLLRSISPTGDQTTLSYLSRGQVDTVKNHDGLQLIQNAYSPSGSLTKTTNSDGLSIRFEYDANGRQTARIAELEKDGRPFETRNETDYDASDRVVATRLVERSQSAAGQWTAATIWSTSTAYDLATGKIRSETDQRGLKTEYFYDRRGNPIQTLSEVELREPSTNGSFVTTKTKTSQWMIYDERGRIVLSTDSISYLANTPWLSPLVGASKSIYDAAGRVIGTQRLKDVVVQSIDANGLPPDLSGYSNYNNLRSTAVANGTIVSSTKTEYDSAGRAIRSRDANGQWSETFYGFAGEVVQTRSQTKDADGRLVWLVTRTAFDELGRAILTTDTVLEGSSSALGTRTFFDELGRTTKVERRFGVQLTLLDRFGAVVRDAAIAQGPFLVRIDNQGVNQAGDINLVSRSLNFYNPKGQIVRTVTGVGPDHEGVETRFEYDERGRQIRQIGTPIATAESTDRLRAVTETEYDSQGRAFRTWTNIRGRDVGTEIALNRQFALSTTQVYDQLGRAYKTIYPDGSTTQIEFDVWGQIAAETDHRGKTNINAYDANGRLITVTLPAVPDPFDSDADGVTELDAPRFEYAYDWAGNQTLLQDANGRRTRFVFDSMGHLMSRTLAEGTVETFMYNDLGQRVTHTSFEGVVTESIYDNGKTDVPENAPTFRVGTGRLIEERYYAPGTYNGAGLPSEVWTFAYDAHGRKTLARHATRILGVLTTDREERWVHDDRGQLIQESKPEGNINYAYDPVTGQRTRTWTTKASGLASANLADAVEDTRFSYNELGWLTTVTVVEKNDQVLAAAQREQTKYGHDILGRQLRIDHANGVIERTEFDRMSAVARIRQYGPDATPFDLGDNPQRADYQYTLQAGKRTKLIETLWMDVDNNPSTPSLPKTTTYDWLYDDNGRLTQEIIDSFENALDRTDTFEMDLFGNRRKRTIDFVSPQNIDEAIAYFYDGNDRLQSEQTDRGANGTVDKSTTYAWNGTQQATKTETVPTVSSVVQSFSYSLTGAQAMVVTENRNGQGTTTSKSRVEYVYDSMGIRVKATDYIPRATDPATWEIEFSTEYLIDDNNHTGYAQSIVETKRNASGSMTKRVAYTFGTDEITQTTYEYSSSSLPPNVSSLQFAHDAHGSVRVMYDAMGVLTQAYTYAAYGELLSIHNARAQMVGTLGSPSLPAQALTSMLYSGETYDSRIGQQYLRARWYSGHRFTTLDPFGGSPSTPQSYNKYGYVHGDPIGSRDPSGKYLIAIDGTGTKDWLSNPRNPQKLPNGRWLSHVLNFFEDYSGSRHYDYGPSDGKYASDLPEIEERAYKKLIEFRSESPSNKNEPIDIIGWSRGAYSAMRLAQRLKIEGLPNGDGTWTTNIPVRFLGLYDPVDMTFYDGPTLSEGYGSQNWVTGNVATVVWLHGVEGGSLNRRDYDSGSAPWYNWPRMDLTWNTAKTRVINLPMEATHGAIGGTPGYSPDNLALYNFKLDRDRSIEADTRMRQEASRVGVPISVLPASAYGFPDQSTGLPRAPSSTSILDRIFAVFTWAFQTL